MQSRARKKDLGCVHGCVCVHKDALQIAKSFFAVGLYSSLPKLKAELFFHAQFGQV